MLNPNQIEHFKQHGFVVLRQFVEAGTLANWRDQFWNHVKGDRNDETTWPDDYVVKNFSVDPGFGNLPDMQEIIEQLGGGMFNGGGGSMLVKWPTSESQWQAPNEGHIDGYGPNGWSGGFMLGATSYLDDVDEHGGGFYYWPDSHLPVHEYFRIHPDQIDGSFREREDWEKRGWRLFSDMCPSSPREFVAAAGDVILWHCFLCHTGSSNVNAHPRLGVFSRWHRTDCEEMKWDIPDDLWNFWAI